MQCRSGRAGHGKSTGATQTAVIVPVTGAEVAVAEHRRHLDVAAFQGIPAHLTVLSPFVEPRTVDDALLNRLGTALSSVPAFDCSFSRCQWFGQDVLWLAPEPEQPFRDLTLAVWRAFPDYPPYGGIFAEVVPHLTVGERRRGTMAQLRAAEAAVRLRLPLMAHVDQALLIAGTEAENPWHTVRQFKLPRACPGHGGSSGT